MDVMEEPILIEDDDYIDWVEIASLYDLPDYVPFEMYDFYYEELMGPLVEDDDESKSEMHCCFAGSYDEEVFLQQSKQLLDSILMALYQENSDQLCQNLEQNETNATWEEEASQETSIEHYSSSPEYLESYHEDTAEEQTSIEFHMETEEDENIQEDPDETETEPEIKLSHSDFLENKYRLNKLRIQQRRKKIRVASQSAEEIAAYEMITSKRITRPCRVVSAAPPLRKRIKMDEDSSLQNSSDSGSMND